MNKATRELALQFGAVEKPFGEHGLFTMSGDDLERLVDEVYGRGARDVREHMLYGHLPAKVVREGDMVRFVRRPVAWLGEHDGG